MSELPVTTIVGAGAFVAGTLFGWTAQKTNFCTMGAISDIVFMGDWRRFRAWMLAVAVALAGTQILHLTGTINIGKSIYLTPNFGWAGAILGGLMFGFGMTMGGGCGNKTLVRIGGGNLKSVVVFLVLGFFSYMTLRGLIALGRIQLEASNINLADLGFATQGLPDIVAKLTGLSAQTARVALTAVIGGGLAAWCFKDSEFRGSSHDVVGGLVIGLMVVAGWAVSGVLGADEFDPAPLSSFTFVAPIGGALQYLMSFTGATIDFGVAAVGGVIFGAFLAAKASGKFQWESFAGTDDMLRHLVGAALMGTGGVLALGCTVGQGITGMSTLALSAPIALAAIVFGGVVGMKYLEEGTLSGAVKAALGRG
ncbi:YeeE/YedE family protein [Paramagnetospirillum kuznetsovii]|uniref:YeeE/YedE family protein n=1 Tax=Paramagnetospirillum kuznetsovii TaxID=2053833 RepID=A0A364NU15_9PROT|nr:YeeE/YedE family protein [Paramagnetospirillum kuznetsovii]RAU20578.1 YeeE/YedE family protein [Paramagnetospirillum kuznetsovii]